MDTKKVVIITPEKQEDQQPFVNEECGDTMWDQVLEEHDKKLSEKDPVQEKGNVPAT